MFRFHRGSLEESLKTEVEVTDLNQLYRVVCNSIYDCTRYAIDKSALKIKFYEHDSRLQKDLYVVSIDGIGVLGFLDSELSN